MIPKFNLIIHNLCFSTINAKFTYLVKIEVGKDVYRIPVKTENLNIEEFFLFDGVVLHSEANAPNSVSLNFLGFHFLALQLISKIIKQFERKIFN